MSTYSIDIQTKVENIINKTRKHPFLFIGSGFSKRYLSD